MRSLRLWYILVLSFGLFSPHANSQEKNTRVLNEVSQAYALCYGYYTLVAICLDPKRDADVAENYRTFAKQFVGITFVAGKAAGLSEAALVARLDLSLSQMQKDTDKDCRNISVLLQKYADKCKKMASDPEGAMSEIRERFK